MKIGIIGAGSIGSAFATVLSRANINAIISDSRGPDSLKELIQKLASTVKAGTVEEAAAQEIVLVAVPWLKLPSVLAGLPDFQNRVVIDENNPIEGPEFQPAELHGRSVQRNFFHVL